jgi:hypothetical protein
MIYKKSKLSKKGERIIGQILKHLTPKGIKKEIKVIESIRLPSELNGWIKEYEKVGDRPDFIWKWTYLGMKRITLSSVSKKYRKSVWTNKTISIILNSLIDDLADKRKNKKLLQAALDICSFPPKKRVNLSDFPKKDRKYLRLIKRLWRTLTENINNYPRYKEFRDFFIYDYQQFSNSMKYSYLINKTPNSINLREGEIYSTHNIQGMISFTIDLMCSPKFNTEELGILREIAWKTQRMGRIGNSLTTWEREAHENDFSSEVFAYALKRGIIDVGDLKKENKERIISKIKRSDAEKYFFQEWVELYNSVNRLSKKIGSVDIKKTLSGLEDLIVMHLVSRGLK